MRTTDAGATHGRLRAPVARITGGFVLAVVLGLTAGCAETVVRHGHHFRQTDLQQISPGMGQDQVRASLGTPTTTSPLKSGTAYYYISQTTKQQAFFAPNEVDRQIVAVYFTQTGSVDRVAQYGMKDGKVFDYISRTTPSANTNDETIVQQLFRNLGKRGSVFGE
ncbi:MAG: outer membrane protein assembly factor BamE [Hyphomicrobiaceae bacterium]